MSSTASGVIQRSAGAERNARAALAIVPYWHYVTDILLPQILAAKEKQGGK